MLRRLAATSALLAITLLLTPAAALAGEKSESWWWFGGRSPRSGHGDGDRERPPRSIPEFDPAAIGGITAIIAGGALMVARRKKR